MLFGQDRTQLRRFYCQAWRRFRSGDELQPLERLVAEVVAIHPEYHSFLEEEESAAKAEFLSERGETNPFLHLSLHVAIREQSRSDQPPGITAVYQRLVSRLGDVHEAEHRLMERLAETLWTAQRRGVMPDEKEYLEKVKKLL